MTPHQLARRAGATYLVVTVCGLVADVGVRARLLSDDPAATLAAVRDDVPLLRAALLADLLAAAAFLVTALLVSTLLRDVHRGLARAYLTANAVGVGVMALNMVHQLGVLVLATDAGAFPPRQAAGLVHLLVQVHDLGYRVAGLFYGLGLALLGLLLLRSGWVPRVLGRLVLVASIGYPASLVVAVVAPALVDTVALPLAAFAGLSELALMVWLLVRGVAVPADRPPPSDLGRPGAPQPTTTRATAPPATTHPTTEDTHV